MKKAITASLKKLRIKAEISQFQLCNKCNEVALKEFHIRNLNMTPWRLSYIETRTKVPSTDEIKVLEKVLSDELDTPINLLEAAITKAAASLDRKE